MPRRHSSCSLPTLTSPGSARTFRGYLGRLLEDMRAEPGAEPRPDAELLRVLQAAASAA
jgi:hypothetical protein